MAARKTAARKAATKTTNKPAVKRVYNRRPKPAPAPETDAIEQNQDAVIDDSMNGPDVLIKQAQDIINKLDHRAATVEQLSKIRLFDLRHLHPVDRGLFLRMLEELGYITETLTPLTHTIPYLQNVGMEVNHQNKLVRFVDEKTLQTNACAALQMSVNVDFDFGKEVAPVPSEIFVNGEMYVRALQNADTQASAPWGVPKAKI